MTQILSPEISESESVPEYQFFSEWKGVNFFATFVCLLVWSLLWFYPCPDQLSEQAWKLFSIFFATIVGIITRPLPIGPVVLCGIVAVLFTKTLSFEELFISYDQPGIWMLVMAFFLANGLQKTKLAHRAAYLFISMFGRRTLGLAYGIILCELVLAPFIPSLVARSSCLIFPIVHGIAQNLHEDEEHGSLGYRTGGFLLMAALHGSLISSAMYLTGMAGNPLIADFAKELGANITWGTWFLSASIPVLISFLVIPWLIFHLYKPDLLELPNAAKMAETELKKLGPLQSDAWSMIAIFGLVLVMWLWGSQIGVSSTEACLLGVALLLCFGIISWKDCLETSHAWDTLFWLSALISIGLQLKHLGFFTWIGTNLASVGTSYPWYIGFGIVLLVYFYSHYFFASNVAHVTSMFFAFLVTAVDLGTPVTFAALQLGFVSSLFGGLAHYGSSPAPIYFGAGYVSAKDWWRVGGICALANLIIWVGIGSIWMKVLGHW